MTILARRFLDFFRPGDEIPAGTYDQADLEKMTAAGKVEVVEEAPAVIEAEEAPQPARLVKRRTNKPAEQDE